MTMSKNIKMETFPNDDKLRVVWGYNAIIKNTGTTGVPNTEILLKEILSNNKLAKGYSLAQVSVLDLNSVRHHTIWQGKQRVDDLYKPLNYKEDEFFSFDFTIHNPTSISFNAISLSKLKSYFGYIDDKRIFARLQNTKFTQMITSKGICVLAPSLEFFTSVYAPASAEIREYLMMYNLETTLDNCLKSYKLDKSDYCVGVHTKKMRVDTNEFFLAYGKFNTVSQSRIKKLRASLEISSPFSDRYPDILPYHPTNLQLKGDGIWLDKTTFMMFRVNKYSLPEDHNVYSMIDDGVITSTTTSGSTGEYVLHESSISDDDLEVGNSSKPHAKNASRSISMEVGVLNRSKIHYERVKNIVKIDEISPKIHDYENTENIDGLSSATSDYSKDSESTGNIKVEEDNDKSYLNQAEVLKTVVAILEEMRDKKINITESPEDNIFIEDIMYVTEKCNTSKTQKSTQFARVLKSQKKKMTRWVKVRRIIKHKKEDVGNRNYMLIKILLNDGSFAYLFEIDRKEITRGYLGLIFGLDGEEIGSTRLGNLLHGVMIKKGKFERNSIKIEDIITYKHYSKKDTMFIHLKGKLAISYKKGLFCV